MIYCPKCGKKLGGLVAIPRFCYHCGFRFILPGFEKSAFQIFKEKNMEKKLLRSKLCNLKIKKNNGRFKING